MKLHKKLHMRHPLKHLGWQIRQPERYTDGPKGVFSRELIAEAQTSLFNYRVQPFSSGRTVFPQTEYRKILSVCVRKIAQATWWQKQNLNTRWHLWQRRQHVCSLSYCLCGCLPSRSGITGMFTAVKDARVDQNVMNLLKKSRFFLCLTSNVSLSSSLKSDAPRCQRWLIFQRAERFAFLKAVLEHDGIKSKVV